MIDKQQLSAALAAWRERGPGDLLRLLGFQPTGFRIPSEALTEFGLDDGATLSLFVAGAHGNFRVLRVVFHRELDNDAIRSTAAALYRRNPARRALLIFESPGDSRLVFATWGLGPGPLRLQKLWVDAGRPGPFELDIIAALAVNGAVTSADIALAHARALDREQVTRRFFSEFRRAQARLAATLSGPPEKAARDRLDIALTLMTRLLFLYFIQRKGWLSGDRSYLRHLYEASSRSGVRFYRRRLRPLFFGALNRPPERRSRTAVQLGELPFLNGGLFEPTALEREYKDLDVPNEAFEPLFFDLLDKYQFTLREEQGTDQDVAIDPEMLGKVFEGLMSQTVRGATGAFYTPRRLVDRIVEDQLARFLGSSCDLSPAIITELSAGNPVDLTDAARARLHVRLAGLRILDPAVGSGAFLLSALHHVERLHDALADSPVRGRSRFERRKAIIQRNLFGVDINPAAVRLCELRLWLALIVDLEVDRIQDVPPLPNLDINIRQGDTLVDPIDFLSRLADLDHGVLASRWRRQMRGLAKARDRYFSAVEGAKRRAARSINRLERELALGFIGDLAQQIEHRLRDLSYAASGNDLFGRRTRLTRAQRRARRTLRKRKNELASLSHRIAGTDELPFFSFAVHMPAPTGEDAAFDVIVGNPPWVRTRSWSGLTRRRLRERFTTLRHAGWTLGRELAGTGRGFAAQLDLSALFVERSLELLSDGGCLGFILPAKLARALSAGALRRLLLQETRIRDIEDCSLMTGSLFEATNYPLALSLSRDEPSARHVVSVTVHDRTSTPLQLTVAQADLSLLSGDPEAPWLLAPPEVRTVIRHIQAAGPPLGADPSRRPSRGIFTGLNEAFIGDVAEGEVGARLVRLTTAGGVSELERELLRPALRGRDLVPWGWTAPKAVIWTHDEQGRPLPGLPPAVSEHLGAHEYRLRARADLKPDDPFWRVFRARRHKWGLRVAWRDLGPEPSAVVLPEEVDFLGGRVPLISLNTIYQISAASGEDAHLLAAILNSTVARTYLKAIAERAAGGYFRFLGWTVALLPFPEQPDAAVRLRCIRLSREAHEAGSLAAPRRRSLDESVAELYRLSAPQLDVLRAFDSRLSTTPDRP